MYFGWNQKYPIISGTNEIRKNAKFIKITKAGFYESMVHSVEMIEPTLNYKL